MNNVPSFPSKNIDNKKNNLVNSKSLISNSKIFSFYKNRIKNIETYTSINIINHKKKNI